MNAVCKSVAAICLTLFLGVNAPAGSDKSHDKKQDKDKKQDTMKKHDKDKKHDEDKKKHTVKKLKSQVAKDAGQVALDQTQLTRDSLPVILGGRPDRIAADNAQLVKSIQKLQKDTKRLNQAQSDTDKDTK
jgi:hypothetical protein